MDAINLILKVSVDLFRQYGFRTITMDDIARKAGISKKTLYQHFISKSEVVGRAVTWFHESVRQQLEEQVPSATNAVDGMLRMNKLINQTFQQVNPMALLELQRYFPEAYQLFREQFVDRDIALIRDNIQRGIREGLYRNGLDAELLARYRVECCLLLFQPDSLLHGHPQAYTTIVIAEHFLFGLMTESGEKYYQNHCENQKKETPRS